MKSLHLIFLLFISFFTSSTQAQNHGYVLGPNEGEFLGPTRIIKASPKSGSLNAVMVLDSLLPGFKTTFHIHKKQDEFFYVINGSGTAELDSVKYDIGPGTVIFVPRGMVHNLSVSNKGPMNLLFFFDRPGVDEWFREAHEKYFSKSLPMTIEACNQLGVKYGYICIDR